MGIPISIYIPPSSSTPRFEQIANTTKATEIHTESYFYKPGKFTITFPRDELYSNAFDVLNIVQINRDFWGIILGKTYEASGNSDFLTVSGLDLKGLTESRVTVPPQLSGIQGAAGYDTAIGSSESVMKHFVKNNFLTSTQPKRKIQKFVVAENKSRGILDDRYMSRFELLSNVLTKIGEAAKVGFDIVPNLITNEFVFDCYVGTDRTDGQREVNPVVFDVQRKTVENQTYQYSIEDSKNLFYTTRSGAEFADEALTMTYVRENEAEQEGLSRWEHHLTISADTPTAGDEYNELKRLALIEAENYLPAEAFEAQILNTRYIYGKDYFLGDFVTAQNKKWGITATQQVVSMIGDYSSAGVKYTAGFGNQKLNVFDRLRRQIKNR